VCVAPVKRLAGKIVSVLNEMAYPIMCQARRNSTTNVDRPGVCLDSQI